MHDIEAFLGDVADALPFADTERAEIVEELRAHLDDSTVALQAEGLNVDVARRTALDRLGPPDRLARAMTEARRSPRRLLAAAGAGSWALVRTGVYGWALGLLVAAVAWAVTVALVRFVGAFAFDPVSYLAIGVALYVAGSAAPSVVARRAGYRVESVRWAVAAMGAIVFGTYALIGWSGPLDLVAVAAILALPAWWIVGTLRRVPVGRASLRTFAALVTVAAIVSVGIQLGQSGLRQTATPSDYSVDLGLDRIAVPAPDAISSVVTGEGGASGGGASGFVAGTFTIDVADMVAFAGWTDLRIEAWMAIDPSGVEPTAVSPQVTGPFIVAPAVWGPPGELGGGQLKWSGSNPWGPRAATLIGSVRLDRTPWLTAAWVGFTGVAPDGVRYRITEPQYEQAIFNGTPAQWLEAVLAGR
ncbi:MAG: permease prefix domain 1-containing protein [Chloroflexota bacterium]